MDTSDLLDSTRSTGPGAHRPRRRRPWLAATVAAVAAVSVTAAVTVPRLLSTGSGADGSLPLLSIGGPGYGSDAIAPATTQGGAAASGKSGGTAGNGAAAPYRLTGTLPTGPDHAPVVRLDSGQVAVDRVTALATALGLTGAPVKHGADWWVRSGGAQLTVYAAAGHPWVFARRDAVACPPLPLDGYSGPGSAVGCTVVAPATTSGTRSAYTPPKPLAAERLRAVAAPVLDATGLAFDPVRVSYDTVLADPTVGARPTVGATTTVSADQAGVRTATGWLLGGHDDASYPLRTARSVFESLLTEPQVRPMIACAPNPGGTPTACELPPVQQDVTGATLGLLMAWEKDVPLLVPAWLFQLAPQTRDSDPGQVVRVAVETRYLAPAGPVGSGPVASAAPGGPETPPTPGASGGAGTSSGSTGSGGTGVGPGAGTGVGPSGAKTR